jgi:hypothetical protein
MSKLKNAERRKDRNRSEETKRNETKAKEIERLPSLLVKKRHEERL